MGVRSEDRAGVCRRRRSRSGAEGVLHRQQRRRRPHGGVYLRQPRQRAAAAHADSAAPVVGRGAGAGPRRDCDHGAAVECDLALQTRRARHRSAGSHHPRPRHTARGSARALLRRETQRAGDREPWQLDPDSPLLTLRPAGHRRRRIQVGRVSSIGHHVPPRRRQRRRAAAADDRGRRHRPELAHGHRRRSCP